jgi:predicted amidohydrolase YtcJ
MTIWNAIASFTENEVGSLEQGKFADLVVLDRDLLKTDPGGLRKVKVLATFVAGERVR